MPAHVRLFIISLKESDQVQNMQNCISKRTDYGPSADKCRHSQVITIGFDLGGKKVGSAVLYNHLLVLERFLKVLEL